MPTNAINETETACLKGNVDKNVIKSDRISVGNFFSLC